jgi:parallel beta-helix repeat protein
VHVAPGTYYKKIIINEALMIKSTDGAEDTIIQGVSTSDYYLVDIQHSDITFDGFTITNPTTAFGSDVSGILVQSTGEPVSNVQILNNIITQIRSETGTPSMYGATGINIGNGPLSDIVISGNTIMDIDNPDGASVDHTCGINVWDGADNILISDNDISDIKYNGIILQWASNVQIEENSITECEVGIRVEPFEGVTVSYLTANYNNLFGNTEYGVLNTMGDEIDATYNYWGSPIGPCRQLPNGKWVGKGDTVSSNVDYVPWLPLAR